MGLSANVSKHGEKAAVFSTVFILVWVGGAVVTINAVLVGGNCSFFHGVCVLGYCMAPMVAAALVMFFLQLIQRCSLWFAIVRLALVGVTCIWSCLASVGFMASLVPKDRRWVATYPVVLEFLCLGLLTLLFS